MDYSYVLTPFLAWFIAGVTKFAINSIKARQLAFGLIGYGGLPSNHSAIVSSMTMLIALKEGIAHPAFGIALTSAFIVLLDASSLRQQVGKHAAAINRLSADIQGHHLLRERMGHSRTEILAGVVVGISVATLVWIYAN
ncbi:MAG: divergent PAP2 family protein [Sideroxydans sp.]|nr:divergent PAP2 family protein [Sideroxydans sp.]